MLKPAFSAILYDLVSDLIKLFQNASSSWRLILFKSSSNFFLISLSRAGSTSVTKSEYSSTLAVK
jgi:hypothetical protein